MDVVNLNDNVDEDLLAASLKVMKSFDKVASSQNSRE